MKVSEMIKKLEELKEQYGDIRVTVYDDYKAEEGWDYKNEELWLDAEPIIDDVIDDNDNIVEQVITIR